MSREYFKYIKNIFSQFKLTKKKWLIPLFLSVLQTISEGIFFALCFPLMNGLTSGTFRPIKIFQYHLSTQWNHSLLFLSFLLIAMVVLKECLRYIKDLYILKATLQIETELFDQIIMALLKKDKSYFETIPLGKITHNIRSGLELSALYEFSLNFIYLFMGIIVILFFCLKISIFGTITLMASIPVFYFINKKINAKIYSKCHTAYIENEFFEQKVSDYFQNIFKFKFSGEEGIVYKQLKKYFLLSQDVKLQKEQLSCLIPPLQQVFIFSIIFLATISLSFYHTQKILVIAGNTLLYLYFLKRLLPALMQISSQSTQMVRYIPSIKTILNLLRAKPKTINKITLSRFNGLKTAIEIKNLSFSHEKLELFKNFSMTLKKGQVTALVGTSGVGKTTLAQLLLGLLPASPRSIFYDGVPLEHHDMTSLRTSFHYLTQKPYFLNTPLVENAQESYSFHEILKILNFDKNRLSEKNIQETMLGEQGSKFSGGELKRLQLALFFQVEKNLFILDEPTANLDDKTAAILWDEIFKLCENKTVLIITHDKSIKNRVGQFVELKKSDQQISPFQQIP